MTDSDPSHSRRPLASRGTAWAGALTRALLASPITPNQVSLAGIVFALLGAWAMLYAARMPWLWLVAALGIQLRLLANLLDGMVAVEGRRGGPTGALFNELPDRIEDSVLLVAAGIASGTHWLGWLCALLAMAVAYVRAVGAALGFGQDFRGPMAKPHRMAALTVASIGSFLLAGQAFALMRWMLIVIAVGAVLTLWRRIARLGALLEAQR
jgi:phosphatidylglycerophosphate synthase